LRAARDALREQVARQPASAQRQCSPRENNPGIRASPGAHRDTASESDVEDLLKPPSPLSAPVEN
jgi:hypothetical protein